jgi:hypothetical protein
MREGKRFSPWVSGKHILATIYRTQLNYRTVFQHGFHRPRIVCFLWQRFERYSYVTQLSPTYTSQNLASTNAISHNVNFHGTSMSRNVNFAEINVTDRHA